MKYAVYDNDKPAKYPECGVHPSWANNSFDTLKAAIEYADKWLGCYSPGVEILMSQAVNQKYEYNGFGDYRDYIEIKNET